MDRRARKYLHDIRVAGERVLEFTDGKSLDDYLGDALMRSAVERQFEIIGEALNQLSKHAPEVAAGITDRRQIIGFRNLLIHGYAEVDDRTVWGVVCAKVRPLLDEVERLGGEA